MWMSLSSSRWICLVTLATVMMLSESVQSSTQFIGISCCHKTTTRQLYRIKDCFEQLPRSDCSNRAFRIITKRGRQWCISPAADWVNKRIQEGKLRCRSEFEVIRKSPIKSVESSSSEAAQKISCRSI